MDPQDRASSSVESHFTDQRRLPKKTSKSSEIKVQNVALLRVNNGDDHVRLSLGNRRASRSLTSLEDFLHVEGTEEKPSLPPPKPSKEKHIVSFDVVESSDLQKNSEPSRKLRRSFSFLPRQLERQKNPDKPEKLLSLGKLGQICKASNVVKHDGGLIKLINSEIEKNSFTLLQKEKVIDILENCCFEKMEENDHAVLMESTKKTAFEILDLEEKMEEEIQETIKSSFILHQQQLSAVKLLEKNVTSYINKNCGFTANSLRFCLDLEEILNVLTMEKSRTESDFDTYLKHMKNCLDNTVFGDVACKAFGGKEVVEIVNSHGLSVLKEMIHSIHWSWLKVAKVLSSPFEWQEKDEDEHKLDQIKLKEVANIKQSEETSPQFNNIVIGGKEVKLTFNKKLIKSENTRKRFFTRVLREINKSNYEGLCEKSALRDDVKKLLDEKEIPASNILRLSTISAWSKCRLTLGDRFPDLYNGHDGYGATTSNNRLNIGMESEKKIVVTQKKECIYYKNEDEGGRRNVFGMDVNLSLFLEKVWGMDAYSGEIPISLPKFYDATTKEKKTVLRILSEPKKG